MTERHNTMAPNVTALATELSSEDESVRLAAVESLCRCGAEARGAAVAIVRAVGDKNEGIRELATGALEGLGPPDPAAADQLAALLSDANPDVGYWAATLLGRLGEQATGFAAQLADALADSFSMRVRQRATWALGKIGPTNPAVAEALRAATASDDPRLARLAAQALEKIDAS